MMMALSPWLLLSALLALGASHTFAYVKGGSAKENSILAEQKRQDDLLAKFQQSTADAISQIKVKNVTVRQETEREIVHLPADCVAPDRLLELTNEAITGNPAVSASELPAARGDDREDIR